MNYYRYNIGDFNNATRHLTRIERLIYRDLIDLYYDRESPLPLDINRIARIALVPKKELTELQNILDEFFVKTEAGYINVRCDFEIREYHKTADKARENGKHGGRPKKPHTNQEETKAVFKNNPEITERVFLANPDITQTKANQEPITNNHKPVTSISPTPFETQECINFWKEKTDFEVGPLFYVEKELRSCRNSQGLDEIKIKNAITNYSKILNSSDHFYSFKHTLSDFLRGPISKFLDSMTPLENFKKDSSKKIEKTEVKEDKYAQFYECAE